MIKAEWTNKDSLDLQPTCNQLATTEGDPINSLPSADRPTGEWVVGDAWPHNVYCSVCYKTFAQAHWTIWEDGTLPRNYCPNCGARMTGGEDDA